MQPLPDPVRLLLAVGATALLVGGCWASSSSTATPPEPSTASSTTASTSAATGSPEQDYLDAVNALCDRLLPRVIKATHGGSLDITSTQYLADWPAHERVLKQFDASLADVPVPAEAEPAAHAMAAYVRLADHLDAARLKAARAGERAWRREVASEADVESDPAIAARDAAGFAASCDAR